MGRSYIVATTATTRLIAMLLSPKQKTVLLPPSQAEAFFLADNTMTYTNRLHREESFSLNASFPLKTTVPISVRREDSVVLPALRGGALDVSAFELLGQILVVNPLFGQSRDLARAYKNVAVWSLHSSHRVRLAPGFGVDHLEMGEMRLSPATADGTGEGMLKRVPGEIVREILTCPETNAQLEGEVDSIVTLVEEIAIKGGSHVAKERQGAFVEEIVEMVGLSKELDGPTIGRMLDPARLVGILEGLKWQSNDYIFLRAQLGALKAKSGTDREWPEVESLLKCI